LNVLKVPEAAATIQAAQAANPARGIQEIGKQILNPPALTYGRPGSAPFSDEELAAMQRGDAIYKELCFSCHGDDGRGAPVPGGAVGAIMAPAFVGNPRITGHADYVIKTLLHGLTGPLDGRAYAGAVMVPMGSNRDEWIASAASYIRNTFGNAAPFVSAADVARVRAATAGRTANWTFDQLVASVPAPLPADAAWKATASHNPQTAAQAFNFATWSSGSPQAAGMWFQVELPQPTPITEIQFESSRIGGGRGAGAPPPTSGYPREYVVDTSTDGTQWTTAARGAGTGVSTAIRFSPVQAKFVRLTQTASADGAPPWSMLRLRLYRPGAGS
jgi:mono/diheme cytochrome c family protein